LIASIAGYGQATYELTDKLNVTAGIRYTEDEKEGTNSGWKFTSGHSGDLAASWDEVTYRLAFDWQLDNDTLLFASYSTGYKSGGGNQVQRTPDLTYSIGMSNEWLLRDSSVLRLRLDNSYTDEIYYTAFNRNGGFSDPGGSDLADDYTNLNARLFWYSADDRWAVELSATNLTDEKQKGRASRRFNSSAIANSSERCGVSRSSGINLTAIGYTVPVIRLE